MRLPKSLYTGYRLLKKSRAVLSKQNDKEAITYFQNILNSAQPSEEDFELYKFVKSMFNENKYKFLKFIADTKFECWILWTDSRSIINHFKLRGVLYIKWLGKDDLYSVSEFVSNKGRLSTEPPKNSSIFKNKFHIEAPIPEQTAAQTASELEQKNESDQKQSWGDSPE